MKMKMAIILGVSHMQLGVTIKASCLYQLSVVGDVSNVVGVLIFFPPPPKMDVLAL